MPELETEIKALYDRLSRQQAALDSIRALAKSMHATAQQLREEGSRRMSPSLITQAECLRRAVRDIDTILKGASHE